MKNIKITGACIHNLKNLNVLIPKNKIVVITGVSGSGKSSLAFDIVFEEGRKQYLQSLGVFAELNAEEKYESIAGLGPTIAVQQNIIRQSNPRSTVGTKTSLLKMLALLYSLEGTTLCSVCDTVLLNEKCPNCGNKEEHLPTSYFLYNNSDGMCLKCSGKGFYYEIDLQKLIPNQKTTLKEVFEIVNPSPGFKKLFYKKYKEYLNTAFYSIPDEVKIDILYGKYVSNNSQHRSYCLHRIFEARYLKYEDNSGGLYNKVKCTDCDGYRIGKEAQRVLLNGKHIGQLCNMTLKELQQFVIELAEKIKTTLAANLLQDIQLKLNSLCSSHLGHLSLYREVASLSGGELQRLFLYTHLHSKMESLIYVLDEPTAGLHESEKIHILESLKRLKDLGNTVIIVEHDKNTIEIADYIIDIGPKAGVEGGFIVYEGNYQGLLACKESITGQYLAGKIKMPKRQLKRIMKTNNNITIKNANSNNLKNISVNIPLNALVGIAGVSGSGKSSLISNTLITGLKSHFNKNTKYHNNLSGLENISGYIEVAQMPIGRNKNSNVVSYIGLWEKIRKIFAEQKSAREQQLSAGHFSFNSKGACPECGGTGQEKLWLGGNFFIYNVCKECNGKRYNETALAVTYHNKNIVDILNMTVAEAVTFFKDNQYINNTLKILNSIGMGYIKLGQPTPTLSGGEAQRIKLAKEIGKKRKGNILYVLDEPTVGLSLYDSSKLIKLLDELVAKGNSVIVIEHDPNVLSVCDWLIELGPKGGAEGGLIIAEGSPADLKISKTSVTGRFLDNE
ncbi:excinuclease ABC subunit UvrA [Clostridium sp. 'deep sea']|uniref:excinuclease ABC subunit UvrA n=1 Tax=Clostridium sp. 'deep sea' TaxID=2779445 RepID=UPI00189658B3|nr:excinuclease ABC subunit UvrA [Clostridium sp. 'deep sea']QOR35765.1 excinuclease ABC subunit UvrA [Clostridium sp. 'deep sea']